MVTMVEDGVVSAAFTVTPAALAIEGWEAGPGLAGGASPPGSCGGSALTGCRTAAAAAAARPPAPVASSSHPPVHCVLPSQTAGSQGTHG